MVLKKPKNISTVVEEEEKIALEDIGWREHLTPSEISRKAIQEYVKNHGDGNNTFKLEQFQDPNFRAMPATMSPMTEWSKFLKENTTPKERREIDLKARSIVGVIKRIEESEKQ